MKRMRRTVGYLTLALCGGLLAYGISATASLEKCSLSEAQAVSGYTVLEDTHVKVRLPVTWKKILETARCQGHTSGGYQARFAAGASPLADVAFEVNGVDYKTNYAVAASKTTAKYKKAGGNDIVWTLKNKDGNKADVIVRNIYCTAWCKAHGSDDGHAGLMQSTKKIDKLIKTYSNGKASYSKVVKLSKKQAISSGKKAIKIYSGKYIVPGIELR